MKIYTRTGDDGTTGLLGGSRLRKSDPRLACTGALDELNASIGWAAVAAQGEILEMLRRVQAELFVIGSHIGAPEGIPQRGTLPPLEEAMISQFEAEIDAAETMLPPLRNFILPGGCELAARLHLARTVGRRAERAVVEFAEAHQVAPIFVKYLNRLSDWLFVQARLANHVAGVADIPWNS